MTTTTQDTPVELHLQKVALAQMTFKPGKCQAVAVAIALAFSGGEHATVWADEVTLPELNTEDANIVGSAWKNLARWGIIERLEGAEDHRRSRTKSRKGGVAWRYRLVSPSLLKAFLKANNTQPKPEKYIQPNLI